MADERRERHGESGTSLILGGIVLMVVGVVAFGIMTSGGLESTNTRGFVLGLLGVPAGVGLLIAGIVRTSRGRR